MTSMFLRCIQERTAVEMIYLSRKGNISHRMIIPYSLHGDIIKGYCSVRKEIRTFHIRNILSVQFRFSPS